MSYEEIDNTKYLNYINDRNRAFEGSEEDWLKFLVKNCENRYIWYRYELVIVYKDKEVWPPDASFTTEWKAHLKYMRNIEEKCMKDYREDLTHLRQGLNPPSYYTSH